MWWSWGKEGKTIRLLCITRGNLCQAIMPLKTAELPESHEVSEGENKTKTWGSTGITGLVRHNPSGIYYHRYSVKKPGGGSKRTYRSLKTRRFPTAKLKLGRAAEKVEIQRQSVTASTGNTDNLRTLGDFETLFLLRLETTEQNETTKNNYKVWLRRLAAVWPEFKTTMVDRVDGQTLFDLRTKLKRARFHKGRTKKWTRGYSVGSTNQTLLVVKLLLDLAREKRVIFTNPFNDDRGLFGAIFLPKENKKLNLPSHFDMERIFAEVAKPPAHPAAWLAEMYREKALNASENARFLSFSGMRHEEGNAAQWEDILPGGQRMRVRGTKSESSERVIPIIPAMAQLLEEIKQRRLAAGLTLRGPILRQGTCLKALGRACARLSLPRLTQHGLRHYYATICIESCVDVPTVSRWLGHADGGAIALRVYGHLRDEHSVNAAQRGTFGVRSVGAAQATA